MAKADFEGAKKQYPSTLMDATDWIAAFDVDPDIMWKVLADVFNVDRDERDREEGKRRIGRRPVRAAGSIDELQRAVIPPQFTNEPFPKALKALLGHRSQRQFAPRVPIAQPTLSRLLSGTYEPDLAMLQLLATACRVPPHYFVEYRALFFGELVRRVLTERPHLGITAYKRYRNVDRPRP